jgi:peptide/nickel transport system substrate-binding protein
MSTDDFVVITEETHPVIPAGLDLFLHEPGAESGTSQISRRAFLAGAAGGMAFLAGGGGMAEAAMRSSRAAYAKPLTGLAAQGILEWDSAGEPAQLNPIGPANDPTIRRPTVWNSSSLFRFRNAQEGVVFDLAKGFKVARDGSYWDVFLRPGVTWHDGSPFTAQDVATTYNTVADVSYGSTWTGFFSRFGSAEVIDNLTVRMHMKQDATWWIYLMAGLPIVKASEALNKTQLATKPTGTGPFTLTQWNNGDRMIFTPNTSFYGDSNNRFKRGLPRTKGLQYVIVPDANTRMINLVNGASALTADVPPAALRGLRNNHGVKVYSATNTPNRLFYYHPNSANYAPAPAPAGAKPRPEWADINNRKALAYALDRTEIAKVAFAGQAVPATSTLGIGSLFYNPKLVGYGPTANVAKAKAFLNAASVKINRTLDFIISGTAAGPTLDAATIMQANWKAIGVDVNITPLDAATASLYGRTQNFDISLLNTVTGATSGRSPNSWLVFLTPGGTAFHYQTYPPELQQNINTINGSLTRADVQKAMDWVQQFEIDQCVTVGVVYPSYFEAQGVPLASYGVMNLGHVPYRVEEAAIISK